MGGILRNDGGELLIVKPSYRPGWLLPGGICEPNEPPRATLLREASEELGILIKIRKLLCVDYLSADNHYQESIHFLFECETISSANSKRIQLPPGELLEYRFCEDRVAVDLLVPSIGRRLSSIETDGITYLEDGATLSFR